MDSIMKGLFGGDSDQHRSNAHDFVSRYEEGGDPTTGFSGQEAMDHYQRAAQHLSPEEYEMAAQQAFSRMNPQQRMQFGQMLQQRMSGGMGQDMQFDDPRQLASLTSRYQREEPNGLASLFGGGGGGGGGGLGDMLGGMMGGGGGQRGGGGGMGDMLDNPIAKAALGGIAAIAFKNMINR